MHPRHPRQVFLIGQEQHHDKEEDEISTQHHHHTEHVERKRHIRHQFVHILDITVTEIGYIIFQHFGSHLCICLIARSLGCTIGGKRTDGRFPFFYFLFCRKRHSTVLQRVSAFQQVIDAGNKGIRLPFGKQRQHLRDFHTEKEWVYSVLRRLLGRIQQPERYQSGTLPPFIITFHSSQLHRLLLRHLIAGAIARPGRQHGGTQTYPCGNLYTCQRKFLLALLPQIPAAHPHYKHGSQYPAGQHTVEELVDSHRRSGHSPEVHHLVACRIGIELHTYGILHPRIGNQNPPGRNRGAQPREPSRCQMETLAHLIPAEEHDGDKRCFHKESQNTLDGKRRTEDVAHKPTVITPIRTEFKFQNDTGCHTNSKVDTENLHPEFGSTFPKFVTRTVVRCLHDAHNYRQSKCQRHKNPVIDGGQGKLGSRPVNQGSVNVSKHKNQVMSYKL